MTKNKDGMEDLGRLSVIDALVQDELFAMTDEEIAVLVRSGDIEKAAAIFAQASKDCGRQRLADARAAMRAAPMRGATTTAPRPPARPSAQRPMTLAARNAKAGHSADLAGIEEDLAELEADRDRDRDKP